MPERQKHLSAYAQIIEGDLARKGNVTEKGKVTKSGNTHA